MRRSSNTGAAPRYRLPLLAPPYSSTPRSTCSIRLLGHLDLRRSLSASSIFLPPHPSHDSPLIQAESRVATRWPLHFDQFEIWDYKGLHDGEEWSLRLPIEFNGSF